MIRRMIFLMLIVLLSCKGKEATDTQVTKVKKGTFMEEITEQGTR